MVRTDAIATLCRDAWFASLRPEMAELMVSMAIERRYGQGQVVYSMNDVSSGMYCVLSGCVRLSQFTPGGKHVLFGAFHTGVWFGLISEFDGQPRPHTAIAVEPTVLLHLPSAAVFDIMSRDWRNAFDLGRCVVALYRRTLAILSNLRMQAYPSRVAQMLLAMSDNALVAAEADGSPKVTQEDLAAVVGVTRQTIHRLLTDWESRGLVARGYGRIRLLDPASLTEIANATD